MYAVGTFTTIQRFSTTYARNNAFSFSATTPYAVTSWNPAPKSPGEIQLANCVIQRGCGTALGMRKNV